ncbi:hypothetical protein [Sphingomonas abietis]|uniref:UrcA family protein n=1 Tax=Sphingomonas abietis TaxID=3012344 RepID=A0ABY7NPZ4_9SPHN|nr:hypothetical protein [Sphingomonas abietis]WBO23267.1 hypothetical protein PBT88_03765 [Sphingomonas abietis]
MFIFKIAALPIAAAGLMLVQQAFAETPAIESFRSIEFEADPASRLPDVRADLAARIPQGSRVADARTLMHDAGAHCRQPATDGRMRCRYNDLRVQDEILQDVSWTVDFQTTAGTVDSFTVERDPAHD